VQKKCRKVQKTALSARMVSYCAATQSEQAAVTTFRESGL
jgi:hypothetical protein